MKELTNKEALATVEAINSMLGMLGDLMMQTSGIQDAIVTLESAKNKIEKIYKSGE